MTKNLAARRLLALAAVASLGSGFMTSSANAATAFTTFQVTANVPPLCIITAPGPLAFGAYDPLNPIPNDATTVITINCTPGTVYTVGLDVGANATRRMADSGNFLDYEIYLDPTHTTVWNDIGGSNVNGGTFAAGAPVPYTAYGRIPALQSTVVTGTTYVDTVRATVSY